MKLLTSNENKLNEFKRFGLQLEMERGKDIAEVDADPITVVLYKAIEVGKDRIVEDTSLHIEGTEVGANIRWLLDTIPLHHGKQAKWEVLLGVNDGTYITIYQGIVSGLISNKHKGEKKGFGFDAFFVPNGTTDTLFELEQKGLKDVYSARKKAIECLHQNMAVKKVRISDIPQWKGNMQ